MEVHRQKCIACGSLELRNLLVREPGSDFTVYVRCASCDELVARYEIGDYYHHGKGAESYFRSRKQIYTESSRAVLGEYAQVQKDALKGFQRALIHLEEKKSEES